MLTPEAMFTLAAELADAQAREDAETLAAIAWQLYGTVGENLAEISRLRAAIHAAWNPAAAAPHPGSPRHVRRPRPAGLLAAATGPS